METIYWSKSDTPLRQAVIELCGWVTKKGIISQLGKRLSGTSWNDLSNAARNVLIQHGIKE